MKQKVFNLIIIIILLYLGYKLGIFDISALEKSKNLPLPEKPIIVYDQKEIDEKTHAFSCVVFVIIAMYIITRFY